MPVLVAEESVLIVSVMRGSMPATKLGLKSIPVLVARGWTEEEKRAYRL